MVSKLHSVAFHGIDARLTDVEVDVARRGFAGTIIVGLPDAAVKESIERVRSAMQNSGYSFPRYKTVINLAPADLRKEGPAFDLPIALGILLAAGDVIGQDVAEYLITGELALDGRIRPVRGCLSAAILAKERGLKGIILPRENGEEAAVVDGIDVIPVTCLPTPSGFWLDNCRSIRFDTCAQMTLFASLPIRASLCALRGCIHPEVWPGTYVANRRQRRRELGADCRTPCLPMKTHS